MGSRRPVTVVMEVPGRPGMDVTLPVQVFVVIRVCVVVVVTRILPLDPGLTLATSANRTHRSVSDWVSGYPRKRRIGDGRRAGAAL